MSKDLGRGLNEIIAQSDRPAQLWPRSCLVTTVRSSSIAPRRPATSRKHCTGYLSSTGTQSLLLLLLLGDSYTSLPLEEVGSGIRCGHSPSTGHRPTSQTPILEETASCHTRWGEGRGGDKTMAGSLLLADDRLCWEKGKWHEPSRPSVSTSQNTCLCTRPSAGPARGPPSCQTAARGRL